MCETLRTRFLPRLSAAHLPDADERLTLECVHSVNVAGTSRPTDDWYGAEKHVDSWLGPALQLLRTRNPTPNLPDWLATLFPGTK